jgi:hypothetical protein
LPSFLVACLGVIDFGAVFHAAAVLIGDKLGLYKKLAELGPMDSTDLAKATGTVERYVREWEHQIPRKIR